MEYYLVDSHIGGYYVSTSNPEIIEEVCEECGDYDSIILSWEDNQKMEVLSNYFENLKYDKENIIDNYNNNETKEEIISDLLYKYECNRYMMNSLCEEEIITKEEKKKLLKVVALSEKKQFELLKSINYDEIDVVKKMKYKHKKNK